MDRGGSEGDGKVTDQRVAAASLGPGNFAREWKYRR